MILFLIGYGVGLEPKSAKTKKADVAEYPQVFDHVGLLANEPPGTAQVALHLVIRHQFQWEIAIQSAATLPIPALYAANGQRQEHGFLPGNIRCRSHTLRATTSLMYGTS
jgi:hypothetical protein